MSNLQVKNFENLEKDPVSGAVLLKNSHTIIDIKVENLLRKVKVLEKQNEEILQLLKTIVDKNNA